MLAERWMSPTALKAAFKTSKRISPKRNPHFSPGRWWHDEKQFIFSTLIGSIKGLVGIDCAGRALACSFPLSAHMLP